MNPTIKKQWVEALRSGEYKQGREYLRQGDKFCCLGVLCDLYGKQHGVWLWDRGHSFMGELTTLARSVYEWAVLSDENPNVILEGKITCLAKLNDGDDGFCASKEDAIKPHTFLEIADIIEAQL